MATKDTLDVAAYLRVSTPDQEVVPQERDVRECCTRRGWTIAASYSDHGISGAKARRLALDRMV